MTGGAPGKYIERRPRYLELVAHDMEIGERMGGAGHGGPNDELPLPLVSGLPGIAMAGKTLQEIAADELGPTGT